MGYSCSTKASLALNIIESFSEFDIESSEYKYFFEIGKENVDGSITGFVYCFTGPEYKDESGLRRRPAKKAGSFKINQHGQVVRFPGLSVRLFGVVEIAMIEKYDRMFDTSRGNWETVSI